MSDVTATREEVVLGHLSRVSALFFGRPLAVTAVRAEVLRDFLARRIAGERIGFAGPKTEPIAVTMHDGGIAEVKIDGTLTPRAFAGVDSMSGLVGHDAIAAQFAALEHNAAVRGVVIDMTSPGGAVSGVSGAVGALRALAAKKDTVLVAEQQLASAGYWVGAQVGGDRAVPRLIVGPEALVGGIGSLMVRRDATKADAAAGETYEIIAEMGRKGDGSPHKEITDEERTATLAIIREADRMFMADVHAARSNLSVAAMRKLNGAELMGQAAVDAGLADAVGTVAGAIADMHRRLTARTSTQRPAARAEGGTMEDGKETPAAPAAESKVVAITPEVQAMIDKAVKEGVAAERNAGAVDATQNAREIAALCKHMGVELRAVDFIAAGKSRAEVFDILQAELVAKDAATHTSGTHVPGADHPVTAEKRLDPEKYDTNWNTALTKAHAARAAAIVVG